MKIIKHENKIEMLIKVMHAIKLLAKNLCDSSFFDQNLDLIHSHFTTDRGMSFIF